MDKTKFKEGDIVELVNCTQLGLDMYGSSGKMGREYEIISIHYGTNIDYRLKDVITQRKENWHKEEWLEYVNRIILGGE